MPQEPRPVLRLKRKSPRNWGGARPGAGRPRKAVPPREVRSEEMMTVGGLLGEVRATLVDLMINSKDSRSRVQACRLVLRYVGSVLPSVPE